MDCTKKQLVLPPAGTFDEYLFDGVCAHGSACKSKNVCFSFVMTSHGCALQGPTGIHCTHHHQRCSREVWHSRGTGHGDYVTTFH
jgi:hypothetical protein